MGEFVPSFPALPVSNMPALIRCATICSMSKSGDPAVSITLWSWALSDALGKWDVPACFVCAKNWAITSANCGMDDDALLMIQNALVWGQYLTEAGDGLDNVEEGVEEGRSSLQTAMQVLHKLQHGILENRSTPDIPQPRRKTKRTRSQQQSEPSLVPLEHGMDDKDDCPKVEKLLPCRVENSIQNLYSHITSNQLSVSRLGPAPGKVIDQTVEQRDTSIKHKHFSSELCHGGLSQDTAAKTKTRYIYEELKKINGQSSPIRRADVAVDVPLKRDVGDRQKKKYSYKELKEFDCDPGLDQAAIANIRLAASHNIKKDLHDKGSCNTAIVRTQKIKYSYEKIKSFDASKDHSSPTKEEGAFAEEISNHKEEGLQQGKSSAEWEDFKSMPTLSKKGFSFSSNGLLS